MLIIILAAFDSVIIQVISSHTIAKIATAVWNAHIRWSQDKSACQMHLRRILSRHEYRYFFYWLWSWSTEVHRDRNRLKLDSNWRCNFLNTIVSKCNFKLILASIHARIFYAITDWFAHLLSVNQHDTAYVCQGCTFCLKIDKTIIMSMHARPNVYSAIGIEGATR